MQLPFREAKVVQLTLNLLHKRALFNFPEFRWLMDMSVYMPANITRSLGLNSPCRDAQLYIRKETLSETEEISLIDDFFREILCQGHLIQHFP